jgi:hypothetical protein
MSFMAVMPSCPEVLVLTNWENGVSGMHIFPETELVLATGPANESDYREQSSRLIKLGFRKSSQTFRNPNSGRRIMFFAAAPEDLNKEVFPVADSKARDSTAGNGYNYLDLPTQCGIKIVLNPDGEWLDRMNSSNCIGAVFVVPAGNEELIQLTTKHGYVPAFYLKHKIIFYKHCLPQGLSS